MVIINKEKCKGCGLCVNTCPKGVLALSREISSKGYNPAEAVDQAACISCALCALMCPDVAIKVVKE